MQHILEAQLCTDAGPHADQHGSPDQSETEAGMRRALGLGNQPNSQQHWRQPIRSADRHQPRRRFVSDGEVPVVLVGRRDQGADVTPSAGVSPPANRLAIVETALKSEQQARQRAERSLAEAHAAIRDLTTRLGHAGLTRMKPSRLFGARKPRTKRWPPPWKPNALPVTTPSVPSRAPWQPVSIAPAFDAERLQLLRPFLIRSGRRSGGVVVRQVRRTGCRRSA